MAPEKRNREIESSEDVESEEVVSDGELILDFDSEDCVPTLRAPEISEEIAKWAEEALESRARLAGYESW
jgi:hypothetical protein